jgi:hypothetical protein
MQRSRFRLATGKPLARGAGPLHTKGRPLTMPREAYSLAVTADAPLVLRDARRVTDQPLHVLEEAVVAEPLVRASSLRGEQPSSLLEVEPGARPRQPHQRIVRRLPVATPTPRWKDDCMQSGLESPATAPALDAAFGPASRRQADARPLTPAAPPAVRRVGGHVQCKRRAQPPAMRAAGSHRQ